MTDVKNRHSYNPINTKENKMNEISKKWGMFAVWGGSCPFSGQ